MSVLLVVIVKRFVTLVCERRCTNNANLLTNEAYMSSGSDRHMVS